GPEADITTTGAATIDSESTMSATATGSGGAGGLVGVGVFNVHAKIGTVSNFSGSGATLAYLGDGSQVIAGSVTVKAAGTATATSDVTTAGVGAAGKRAAQSDASIHND